MNTTLALQEAEQRDLSPEGQAYRHDCARIVEVLKEQERYVEYPEQLYQATRTKYQEYIKALKALCLTNPLNK